MAEPRPHNFQRWKDYVGFFILGTINNLAYVVVLSAAKTLAEHNKNLFGLIPWANVFFGFVFRVINVFLEGVPFAYRVLANTLILSGGLFGLSMSGYISFWFALGCIVFVGGSSSFGESILLGFMKGYPAEVVGGWSSGTGMAGVAGSLLYLGFVALGMNNEEVFLSLIPFAVVYFATYALVLSPPAFKTGASSSEGEALLSGGSSLSAVQAEYVDVKQESSLARILRCTKVVWWVSLQLAAVYFFEYVASTGAADRAEKIGKKANNEWVARNAYAILAFCYQFGVLISRSSLYFIQLKRFEILTSLQGINFLLWLAQDYWHFMNIWVQFGAMLYVGLLGGAAYVNVFYQLLNDESIQENDRELCVNIAAIAINVGITLSSVFTLIMDETIFKEN